MQHIIPMELTDLNSSIEMKLRPTYGGLPEYGTAEGDIASFITNINYPLKKLEADIVAQQDLHGYDHPWAGGAGKNVLPVDVSSTTVNGITFTIHSDGTITCNGTATGTVYFLVKQSALSVSAGTYTISLGINDADIRLYNDNHGLDSYYTPTATFDSATSFPVYLRVTNGKTLNNVLVKPMIERGSSATAFEPYSNICPINGFDEVVVDVVGKNLYIGSPSFDGYVNRNGYTLASETYNGHEVIQRTSAWNGAYTEVPVLAGKTYTFSSMVKVSVTVNVSIYNANNDRLLLQSVPANTWTRMQATFTPSEDKLEHLRVEIGTSNTTIYLSEYQLELGSTATSYEPYKGKTYTTDLEATYYGGTLNVTTGELVIDKGYALFDGSNDENWIGYNNNYNGWVITISDANINGIPKDQLLSNSFVGADFRGPSSITQYGVMRTYSSASDNTQVFLTTSITDISAWRTWLSNNNVQLVYPLATPQTYQLTPQEVETVVGQNYVWANSGQVYVEYHFVEDFE